MTISSAPYIAIDWGSTNFRAQLLSSDGAVLEEYQEPKGVSRITRPEMAAVMGRLRERWPGPSLIVCSGMIGSTAGWLEAPYIECPVAPLTISRRLVQTEIGGVACCIAPGLTCRDAAGEPDVMRGEEVEILGLISLFPQLLEEESIVALPGTHTKWVRIVRGVVHEFFTSMSGEIFDRLSESGLLSSVLVEAPLCEDAFQLGLQKAESSAAGLGRLLFGARARVVRGDMPAVEAGSYVRGLLIGAEVMDTMEKFPALARQEQVKLLGNPALCALYATAMNARGVKGAVVSKREASAAGYLALIRDVLETRDD